MYVVRTPTPESPVLPYTTLFRSGFTAANYPAGRIERSACAACGGTDFRLLVDAEEGVAPHAAHARSEEHTSELQSRRDLVCRLLLEKKKERKMKVHLDNKTFLLC